MGPSGKHYATLDDEQAREDYKNRKYEMLKHSVDFQMNEIMKEYDQKVQTNGQKP